MKDFLKAMVVVAVIACAGVIEGKGNANSLANTYHFKDGTISVIQAEKFIQVATDGNNLRIYPCGRVTKKVWKEINPNEAPLTIGVSSADFRSIYDLDVVVAPE